MHANNYVHEDVRRQNILVVNNMVRILDFDWADCEGEARYPPELRMENDWHTVVLHPHFGSRSRPSVWCTYCKRRVWWIQYKT